MDKAQVLHRFYWTKLTFGVFVAFFALGYVLEALGTPEAFLFFVAIPLVTSFLLFTIAFGSFARSLDESAISWIATIVFIPVLGPLLAYLHLGKKYKKAVGEE